MPITYKAFTIGILVAIGFPGLSVFFSEYEILRKVFIFPKYGTYLWLISIITSGCTSFYMVRLLCLTLFSENKNKEDIRAQLKSLPASMLNPLIILAVLSIFIAYLGLPNIISQYYEGKNFFEHYFEAVILIPSQPSYYWGFLNKEHNKMTEWGLLICSVCVFIISSSLSFYLYKNGPSKQTSALKKKFIKIHTILFNEYWLHKGYERFLIRPLIHIRNFLWKNIEIRIIDGLINKIAHSFLILSSIGSLKVSGNIQTYRISVIIGLVGFFILLLS